MRVQRATQGERGESRELHWTRGESPEGYTGGEVRVQRAILDERGESGELHWTRGEGP